jgi:putative membrane protein
MEEKKQEADQHAMSNMDLAYERTMLAESRTLMAWIRTAISMISFGFTIYKFFHELQGPSHSFFSPRKVGMIMIAFGLLGLWWGLVDYNAMVKKLKKGYPQLQSSKTYILAILVSMFGLMLLVGAFFRQ